MPEGGLRERGALVRATGSLLDLVAPSVCLHCEDPVGHEAGLGLCAACEESLPRLPTWVSPPVGVDGAWALGRFGGPLGAVVRDMKFTPNLPRCRALGARLRSTFVGRLPRVDVVCAVPVSRPRRLERGFDQGWVLAQSLALGLGVPAQRRLWRRRSQVLSTVSDRRTRERVARASYRARGSTSGHVLLVDDVLTTGASASACADELRVAGAQRVTLVVAARRALEEDSVVRFA